jgi:hypothetical protein
MNVATALYSVGDKLLHIEITGTGRNPGPYSADTKLTVAPENVDSTWWAWDTLASPLHWKEPYNVGGVLTNRSQGGAAFTIGFARFTEFDDDVTPPTATGNVYDPPLPPSAILPSAASTHFVWRSIIQTWTWLATDTFSVGPYQIVVARIVPPRMRDFGYQTDAALSDPHWRPSR